MMTAQTPNRLLGKLSVSDLVPNNSNQDWIPHNSLNLSFKRLDQQPIKSKSLAAIGFRNERASTRYTNSSMTISMHPQAENIVIILQERVQVLQDKATKQEKQLQLLERALDE